MSNATVSAGYARAFLDFAGDRGADKTTMLRDAGIRDADLADADSRVPLASYQALMHSAQDHCSAPEIALLFGAETDLEQISILGIISQASSTMAEAFALANRYGPLVDDVALLTSGDRFAKLADKSGVWFVDQRADPNHFPELTETTFARIINDIARHFDGHPRVTLVHVTHAAPKYFAQYEKMFNCPVIFSSTKNALLFEEDWNTISMPRSNKYLFGALANHADELLLDLEGAITTRAKVEQLLMPNLHTGESNMETIAKQLNQSRPTLYRRLKAEGISFEQVLDDLRKTMAIDYLGSRKVSVNETAYLVGFSDASSFSRAFKRWTGESPRRFKSNT